ncbi:hypothetical protein ACFQO4_09260 [Saliphagus sp. GCM10025334]
MSAGLSRTIDRLRQPEYTGENRCTPCTAVNVVIAGVLAIAVGAVVPLAGIAVFAASAFAIYVRGYLVPGTPALTKRYFPDWLLAKFDKAPAGYGLETDSDPDLDSTAGHGPDPIHERETRLTPEETLLEANVVEPCVDEDDLCLREDVRREWHERMDVVRDGDRTQQLGPLLEADPDEIEVSGERPDDPVVVRVDGYVAARWESDAALVADLAGLEVLAERVPGWESLPADQRSQLASGLRAFIDTCPACGGSISIDAETVESCCRSYEVYAITCDDCEARLLEVEA